MLKKIYKSTEFIKLLFSLCQICSVKNNHSISKQTVLPVRIASNITTKPCTVRAGGHRYQVTQLRAFTKHWTSFQTTLNSKPENHLINIKSILLMTVDRGRSLTQSVYWYSQGARALGPGLEGLSPKETPK